MLYEDMERIEATETLSEVFSHRAALYPSSDSVRHAVGDLRETALGDYAYDRRGKAKPEISKEEYFRRVEAMGHKAIEV